MRFARTKISFRVLHELEHTIVCLFLVFFSSVTKLYRVSSAGEISEGKKSIFGGREGKKGEERNSKDEICHV